MKKFIILILGVLASAASAQTITVRGTIQDSIGVPLELANVIATVKETGAIESYGITNYEGRYQVDLPVDNIYNLKASFLGYETITKELDLYGLTEDMQVNFTLNPTAAELDGVELVYEMPVSVKGDTIVYNADSFTNGSERKLGDVMKKLPGVEVNDNGEIEVEGKTVNKVMVEGKDFFDGDSKLAVKNIPADAVDKVEVLRNYNEVDQMRGLGNDQDNVAINIKLKEGKKNFWFGEVTAGVGIGDEEEARYLAHPKLFYYSPEYSINIITDFNNIGEVPFTFQDYFKFTGGFRNFNRGTSFNISDSDLGFALMQNNRAQAIETQFFAGNFSWQASKNLDLSGFAILSDNKTNFVTNSLRNYIASEAQEITETNSEQHNQLAMAKLSGIYKPNSNFQLDYDALFKTSKQSESSETLSIVEETPNHIDEELENKPTSINQNVNMYYTASEDHIFAAQLQHLYQDEDPFYNAVLDALPFDGIIPVDESQDRYNLNQEKEVQTHKIDAKLDYYYVINKKSNLNINMGATHSKQQFDSGIFQLLENNNPLYFDDALPDPNGDIYSLTNDVKYTFSDYFLGLRYKFKAGKFTFTPGLSVHNYRLNNEQEGTATTQNDWNVLPDVHVLLEFKNSESLRFNYTMMAEYTDVNNYAEAYVFNNYNRMFRGNRNLENSLSHNYSLNYFNFNMFSGTNINASINYNRRIEAIKNNSLLVGINQVSTPINMDSNFPDETISGYGQYSKRFKKLQFNASARISYNASYNTINTARVESTSFIQNYKASLRSNFSNWPNFELGYNAIINDYENGMVPVTYVTHSPFANVDIKFLKHFTLTADWNLYNYGDDANTVENQYSFLDANLYFRKGESPWEFKVQATNILDTDLINTDNFNEEYTTTTQYYVLPRIVMFMVTYDL